jgi:hypothetical protein
LTSPYSSQRAIFQQRNFLHECGHFEWYFYDRRVGQLYWQGAVDLDPGLSYFATVLSVTFSPFGLIRSLRGAWFDALWFCLFVDRFDFVTHYDRKSDTLLPKMTAKVARGYPKWP